MSKAFAALSGVFVTFLLFAFVLWDINPSNWTPDVRFLLVFLSAFMVPLALIAEDELSN